MVSPQLPIHELQPTPVQPHAPSLSLSPSLSKVQRIKRHASQKHKTESKIYTQKTNKAKNAQTVYKNHIECVLCWPLLLAWDLP